MVALFVTNRGDVNFFTKDIEIGNYQQELHSLWHSSGDIGVIKMKYGLCMAVLCDNIY